MSAVEQIINFAGYTVVALLMLDIARKIHVASAQTHSPFHKKVSWLMTMGAVTLVISVLRVSYGFMRYYWSGWVTMLIGLLPLWLEIRK